MSDGRTIRALASITDEGLFERLSTSVLREADPLYASIVHTGINVEGKTVKAPLDGICFVTGSNPPHLIAVHHTITAAASLERKWLHDPATAKPRKRSRSTVPAGDLIKTAAIVAEERKRIPELRATLVLTTNKEPSEAVVRAVQVAGHTRRIEIDTWSRSRLAHFLDNHSAGQWLRRTFLQIEQEQLSPELLRELSRKSLDVNRLPDDPRAWVSRALDVALATGVHHDVTFLVAGSGLGKSVACRRRLAAHVEAGGFGILLAHDVVASATTVDQAVVTALRQLHPALVPIGVTALSFCSPERPLLLFIEDINRSGQTHLLAEKIAGWGRAPGTNRDSSASEWRLVCPLWPEVLASLGDQARKRIEPLVVLSGGFADSEGREAVLARARLHGHELSSLSAQAISRALGHDPLLIALHEPSTTPDPNKVIGLVVETSLSRAAAEAQEHAASDFREAVRTLAGEMLTRCEIEPSWRELRGWPGIQGEPLRLLSRLAHRGEVIRLTGSSTDQRLSFRHDRVRDWLLADAAAELERQGVLPERVVAEPYFAEVMGAVLSSGTSTSSFLRLVTEANPLALFHALRLFGEATQPHHHGILQAIRRWLESPSAHDRSNHYLRWEALALLADTDSPDVPALVRQFRDRTTSGELARLRNGDLCGGVELCTRLEPGVGAPWRDVQIEHAKLHHGVVLSSALNLFRRRRDLDSSARMGALRLAGHIADSGLARAIETCWNADATRGDLLGDYLGAFGQCCGDDPVRFLGPVCDAWAGLPDEPDRQGGRSARDNLAADQLRWAFCKRPPLAAIDYFVQRGTQDDLRWPITLLLHGMDHPKAVSFVVQEFAAIQRRRGGTESIATFDFFGRDEWRRAQEDGRPMSGASRDLLLQLWRDEATDKYVRVQAFSLWAATRRDNDLDVLRGAAPPKELADNMLRQRLIRGDCQALPLMIEKMRADDNGYWWQYGRYIWSPELSDELVRIIHQVLFRAVSTDAEAERFGGADGADCRGLRLRDTGSGGARCPGGQGGSLAARADSRMRLSL